VFGTGAGEGKAPLDRYAPGYSFAWNVLHGNGFGAPPAASYPSGNTYPASTESVGFVNFAAGDAAGLALSLSSPVRGKGSNGGDPGADVNAVLSATAGVVR
jgi:hypothetical protein